MILRILLAAGLALTLAGCGDETGGGRCKSPIDSKAAQKAAAAVEPGPVLNADLSRADARTATADARACVQRYAWKLSKSKEDTDLVAEAAVTACDAFIAAATQAEQGPGGVRDLNALHDANVRTMTRWATLYVVQYRANVCD